MAISSTPGPVTASERWHLRPGGIRAWRYQARIVLTAVLAGVVGQLLPLEVPSAPAPVALVWVPGGMLLAVLVVRPYREWSFWLLGMLAGGMVVLVWQQVPVLYGLSVYLPGFVGIVWVARGLRPHRVDVFADVALFARYSLLTLLLMPMLAAAICTLILSLGGYAASIHPLLLWLTVAGAYASGLLLVAALALAVCQGNSADGLHGMPRKLEAVLTTLGLLISLAPWALVATTPALLPWWWLAPVPWALLAALRFGPCGAGMALALLASMAAWMNINGVGWGIFEQVPAAAVQWALLALGLLLHLLAVLAWRYQSARLLLSAGQRHARTLTGRLMQKQEEERARIARELHDDVNQQIASLAIAVSALKRLSAAPVASGLEELHLSMIHLSEDVRRISHHLHPSLLEHVGLGAALQTLVQERAQQWSGDIHYQWEPEDPRPDIDSTVCLYRIAQEALRNAIRHSQARTIWLRLQIQDGAHLLMVADDGSGFDLHKVRHAGGLGLLGMQERAALGGGRLSIVSNLGAGTHLHAWLPAKAR